jgi:hypothetical protein
MTMYFAGAHTFIPSTLVKRMNCPSLFIDIEGYSALFEKPGCDSRRGVDAMMLGIYQTFHDYRKSELKDVFAYHIGDGFSISSSRMGALEVEKILCLGVLLMRYILLRSGHFTKCGMAEGIMKDIKMCYPKPIRDFDSTDFQNVGESFMSIMSVMGTALINSNKLQSKARGGVFCLSDEIATDLDGNCMKWVSRYQSRDHEIYHLDWVGYSSARMTKYMEILGLADYTPEVAISKMKVCIDRNESPPDWVESTRGSFGSETNKSW